MAAPRVIIHHNSENQTTFLTIDSCSTVQQEKYQHFKMKLLRGAAVVCMIACCLAAPQYGNQGSSSYNNGGGSTSSQSSSSSSGGYGGSNSGGNTGGNSGTTGGSSGSGGQLVTECKSTDGKKFVCDGVNKDSITLRSEHILWLQTNGGKQQIIDIEVPNYKIDELIKAGFKPAPGGDTSINVLLKKPETTYDAQVDKPQETPGQTKVKLQYEPVGPSKPIHFPTDKQYSPLSGPLLPPA